LFAHVVRRGEVRHVPHHEVVRCIASPLCIASVRSRAGPPFMNDQTMPVALGVAPGGCHRHGIHIASSDAPAFAGSEDRQRTAATPHVKNRCASRKVASVHGGGQGIGVLLRRVHRERQTELQGLPQWGVPHHIRCLRRCPQGLPLGIVGTKPRPFCHELRGPVTVKERNPCKRSNVHLAPFAQVLVNKGCFWQ